MVSSFSNPGFPHVHAHPTRLPAMDASLSAAIDSFEALMRSMRAAFREAIDSALAPIRREIALLRRDLVLGVEGDSDPSSMCSKEAESIEAGHQKLQKLKTHDGDGNPLRIPSTIQDHSIPPLLLSSPMLRALASYPVKPQLKESVAATIPLQHFEKLMPVATVTTVPFPFSAIVGKSAALSQLADQDANVTTHIEGCEDHKSFKMQMLRLCKPTSTHTNTTKRRHEVLTALLSTFTNRKDKWYWILQFILAYYTSVIAIMYEDFLIDKCGWVNWYLVGKFVKKDFYALKLFEKMSEKGSEDKMEIAHWRDFYNSENTSCIWNSCSCTTVVELLVSQFQGISATFYHYATSGPQVGDELFQFKNAEFDHIKGIENLRVRWIALPTASILILLLDGMSKRHNYNWNSHSCSYAVWNAHMLCGMHKLMHHLVLQIHDHDWHPIGDTQSIKVEVKVSVGICHGGYTTLWWLLWRMKAIGITSFAKAPMEFLSPIELQLRMVCNFFYSWSALFVTDQAIHDRIKGIITSMNAQIPYFKKIFSMITNHLTSFLNLKIEVNLPLKKDGTTNASILILLLDGMHFKKYLEFLQNLEEIIEALGGIKVARVDLGVEIPLEQIPTVPEEITNVYRQLNKLVTVAYQFLELVIEYPTPTLAKVADVSAAGRQYAFNIVRSFSIVESLIDAFSQQWFSVKLIYAFCCLLILILRIVGMHYVVNLVGGSKEHIKSMAAIESIALVLAYFTNKRIITSLLYYGGRIGYGKENRERLLGKWEVVDVNDCCSCGLYLVDSGKIYGKHLYNTKNFHVEGSSTVSSRKPVIFADETCATQTAALGNANFAPVFVQGSLASVRNWYQLWAVVHTANAVLESITDTQTELQLMELGECAFYGTNSNQPIQIMKVMVLRLTSLSILWDSGDTRFCQIQSAATVTTPMDHCRNKTSSSFFNLEDIKLRPISKVIILGNGPIAIVAALVENLLAGSLGVGPFSPFDAASCFLATSMEIEMISWVEIYEEATGDKRSLTKLWGAAITSSGVLSGSSPKVESYLQIVFAVPATSLLLQDSLVSARSTKFFKFQP